MQIGIVDEKLPCYGDLQGKHIVRDRLCGVAGGERGIRTLGTLARSTVFETAPFNHSGTSPQAWGDLPRRRGPYNSP